MKNSSKLKATPFATMYITVRPKNSRSLNTSGISIIVEEGSNNPSIDPFTFCTTRNKYVQAINKTRKVSWRSFIEKVNNVSPYGNMYKLLKNKLKPKSFDLPILEVKRDELSSKMNSLLL